MQMSFVFELRQVQAALLLIQSSLIEAYEASEDFAMLLLMRHQEVQKLQKTKLLIAGCPSLEMGPEFWIGYEGQYILGT
jgi:hypothetical protein